MAENLEQGPDLAAEDGSPPPRRRRWGRQAALGTVGVAGLALGVVWVSREDIADNVIAGQFAQMGLPATYRIERIGADRQVLTDVVIGDRQSPDLTIERIEVRTRLAWGVPGIGRVTLVRPRLQGRYRNGKFGFGSLDKVLFTGGKEPFRLPDIDLAIRDGRARLDTDYGAVGLKVEGAGGLRGGFDGVIAALAPRVTAGDCTAERMSLYARISVRVEKPRLVGPARVARLDCPKAGLALASSALQLDATLDPRLDGAEGTVGLAGGALAYGEARLGASGGQARFTWRRGALTARYDLTARDVRTPQVQIQAKIVFVSRTDLEEFGITYDLKDSRGNQLNVVAPGATDTDNDGVIELPEEAVDVGPSDAAGPDSGNSNPILTVWACAAVTRLVASPAAMSPSFHAFIDILPLGSKFSSWDCTLTHSFAAGQGGLTSPR